MKTVRVKILFTIFLFSAIVPSATQAMGGEALKVGSDMVKWIESNAKNFCNSSKTRAVVVGLVVGGVFFKLGWKCGEWLDYHKLEREAERVADNYRKEFLAKVDTGELVEISHGRSCRFTFLNSAEEEKVRKSLGLLKIPKFLAEKILILGMEYEDYSGNEGITRARVWSAPINETHSIPYAITIDTKFLKEASFLVQEFVFDHEVGHVKAFYDGLGGDEEQNEVVADICALRSFVSERKKKDQLSDLVSDPYMIAKPSMVTQPKGPYLSSQESLFYGEEIFNAQQRNDAVNRYLSSSVPVCHGEEIFGIQQRNNEVDPLTYARKIIAARKKDGYRERIEREAEKLFAPTDFMGKANRLLDQGAFDFQRSGETSIAIQYKDGREKIRDL